MSKEYRELIGHRVNPANDTLTIQVVDDQGMGGAHHAYVVRGVDPVSNPSFSVLVELAGDIPDSDTAYFVMFQNGPIAEAGVNGLTHEVLLAILIDRLECFQTGAFANEYNAVALEHLKSAQEKLLERTRERMARGVEGTHRN